MLVAAWGVVLGGCASDKGAVGNNVGGSSGSVGGSAGGNTGPNIVQVASGTTVLGVTQVECSSMDQRNLSGQGTLVTMLNGDRDNYHFFLDGVWQSQGSDMIVIPSGRHTIDWYTVDPSANDAIKDHVLHIEVNCS